MAEQIVVYSHNGIQLCNQKKNCDTRNNTDVS